MKVVCIVDKTGTALDRLGKGVAKYHDNLNYQVIDCHPKRPSQEQLQRIETECRDADIIDAQYFRTIEKLREIFPWLKEKKTILTHNNPYSITESNWNDYDMVIANNKSILKDLEKITEKPLEYVPLTVDTDFWTYNHDWQANSTNVMNVLMVANRIEGKKGILPVAEACKRLNMNLQLVGAISDAEYFQKIIDTGVVKFHEQITDEALRDLYYKSAVHVCNSVDGFESGTQPILESMLCGTPVITRNIGHVPDLNNGENMVLNEGATEDVDNLATLISELIADKKKMESIRDKAWNTAKSRSHERRAYIYQKLYRQVLHPLEAPVTVVLPVCDRPDYARKCLDAIAQQTYKNIEVIVADDSLSGKNKTTVKEFSQYVSFPVRYMRTAQYVADTNHPDGYKDYGLARARNLATIEATGEIMVYCDERQIPAPDAVEEFVKYVKSRHWIFGDKGSNKTAFVENFSAIYRSDIIRFGLFSERGSEYGFQSQYCRAVARDQALKTEFCKSAKATPVGKSSNRNQKRQQILNSKNKLWKMDLE